MCVLLLKEHQANSFTVRWMGRIALFFLLMIADPAKLPLRCVIATGEIRCCNNYGRQCATNQSCKVHCFHYSRWPHNQVGFMLCVVRLWGDHGQEALESAHVCLINASATGTEILKNLVLPGTQLLLLWAVVMLLQVLVKATLTWFDRSLCQVLEHSPSLMDTPLPGKT